MQRSPALNLPYRPRFYKKPFQFFSLSDDISFLLLSSHWSACPPFTISFLFLRAKARSLVDLLPPPPVGILSRSLVHRFSFPIACTRAFSAVSLLAAISTPRSLLPGRGRKSGPPPVPSTFFSGRDFLINSDPFSPLFFEGLLV